MKTITNHANPLIMSIMILTMALIFSCAPEEGEGRFGGQNSAGSSSSEYQPSNPSSSSIEVGRVGYDLLFSEFEGGILSPWEKGFGSMSTANRGTINLVNNPPYGWDAVFTPSGKEVNNYDLQLIRRGLDVKPGYSYTLKFGGGTTKAGTAPVVFALLNCPTTSNCSDYKNWSKNLSTYSDYEMESWNNCSATDPNATFVISGGSSSVEFKIAWVQVQADPINCP